MALPVFPPTIPTVPPYPALGSSNFNEQAYTYATTMPTVSQGMQDVAGVTFNNAEAAFLAAQITTDSAHVAATSAGLALGSANFKGNWSALTGSLALPAAVRHANKFWLLLADLPDVTAAEPGVSVSWFEFQAGASSGIITTVLVSSVTAIPNTQYIVAAAGLTITLPSNGSWTKGAYFGVREVIASGSYNINFSGVKVRGVSYGNETITAALNGVDLTYEDITRGLI